MGGMVSGASRSVGVVVLSLACAPKPAPPPEVAGAVQVAITDDVPPPVLQAPARPVGQSPVAVPGAPELPPLSGALVDLDFVTLHTATQTFTVDSDTPMFPVTDPRVAARMQAALAFDPHWRVGLWEGQVVAWRRGPDAGGGAAPWGGYLSAGGITARSLLRFEARPADHPWTSSELVARNRAGTTAMKVRGWKVDRGAWAGQMAAAFTIDGAGVSFEMHEISQDLTLSATQASLQRATTLAKTISAQLAGGNLQRSSLAMLSAEDAGMGAPIVDVSRSAALGGLDIRGRANGGGPGWVWVRLIDGQGAIWSEEVVAQSTAERIGYDSNLKLQSYFQSVVPVSGAVPGVGMAELWFQADDASVAQLLVVSPYVLDPPVEGPRQAVD